MRAISRIRWNLDSDIWAAVVWTFILPRLDYAFALLYGLPDKTLQKLQLVQHNAARLASVAHRYVPITPVLRQLLWLPLCQRSKHNILPLTEVYLQWHWMDTRCRFQLVLVSLYTFLFLSVVHVMIIQSLLLQPCMLSSICQGIVPGYKRPCFLLSNIGEASPLCCTRLAYSHDMSFEMFWSVSWGCDLISR